MPVPSACVIQILLFTLQHYGTHKIGFLFAPISTIWLIFISGVGLYNVLHWNPRILNAISPIFMFRFVRNIDKNNWRSICSILLCVGGREYQRELPHFSLLYLILRLNLDSHFSFDLEQGQRQCLQIWDISQRTRLGYVCKQIILCCHVKCDS